MIIGVTGGKGGTGKSTVAVNLALALREKGSVTLIDCDVGCPNDHLILGCELESGKDVEAFFPEFDKEKCTRCGECVKACQENAIYLTGEFPVVVDRLCSGCTACMLACPHGAIRESYRKIGKTYETKTHGIRLVSGELKPGVPFSAAVAKATLEKIGENDFTIIDTSAGLHCDVVRALYPCDKVVVVTEPTPFGVSDLSQMMKLLKRLEKEVQIVVNVSDIADVSMGENERFVTERIPFDREVMESYVAGTPLVESSPGHPISLKFKKIARGLL